MVSLLSRLPAFSPRHFTVLTLCLGAVLPCSHACTVPVFRYALDNWEADPFHLEVPEALAREANVANLLRPVRASGEANVDVHNLPSDQLKAPQLVFPRNPADPVWSGSLDQDTLNRLLDSPARRELSKRLLAGDSVIWVMVDDGSEAANAKADHIEKRLRFLQNVTELPAIDPNDPDSKVGPGPELKLSFSVLRVRLDDKAEEFFIRMLRGPQMKVAPDAGAFVAAVFGRGRVLGAWPAGEMDDSAVEEIGLFLCGACSCQVKQQNPGWDVLMKVDWQTALEKAQHSRTQVLSEINASTGASAQDVPPQKNVEPETVTISASAPSREAGGSTGASKNAPDSHQNGTTLMLVGAASLVLIGAAWIILTR